MQLDQFEDQYLADAHAPLAFAFDGDTTFPQAVDVRDEESPAQPLQESIFTDDPVRMYLREMGSVPLLTRQGEFTLARKMDCGKLRMQKAISRSPVIQILVAEFSELVRKGSKDLDSYVGQVNIAPDYRCATRGQGGRWTHGQDIG